MSEKEIVKMYENGYTLRHISDIFKSNHHMIKRILIRNGIEITKRKTLKPYTDEHRRKVGASSKGRKCWANGLKMTREHILNNMKAHLKYDVSLEWLGMFEDIEKLKYLNRSLSRKRDCEGFSTEIYIAFIEKFYYDKKFNDLYSKWVETNDKWIKPSLDHIVAKAKGGSLLVDNLQFISWLENRAKIDIEQDLWDKIKKNINYYL